MSFVFTMSMGYEQVDEKTQPESDTNRRIYCTSLTVVGSDGSLRSLAQGQGIALCLYAEL